MKNIIICLVALIILSGCASSGYSLKDYEKASISKDGVYKFNNPKIKSNLLVKIITYKDKKSGTNKRKLIMLNVSKESKVNNFKETDKNVIVWPFYNIYKNRVGTRIYEKGEFKELFKRHSYMNSAGSYNGEVGFSYNLDFSSAKLIK